MTLRVAWRAAVLLLLAGASFGYATWDASAAFATDTVHAAFGGLIAGSTSSQFIAFVVITLWLAYALLDTRVTRRGPRLVRVGTYRALLRGVAAASARMLVAAALVVVVTSAVAGVIGLEAPGRGLDTAARLMAAGVPLLLSPVAQIALLSCFLIAVRLAVEVLAMTFSYSAAVTAGIVIWVWGALSVNGAIPFGPLAGVEAYTTIGQLVRHPDLIVPVCTTYVLVFAALVLSAVAADRSARQRPLEQPEWLAPCVGAFVVILFATYSLGTASVDVFTHAVTVFAGASGTPLQVLIELVLVVGYAFLALFRLEGVLGARASLTLIRYGSRRRQILAIVAREARLALVFVVTVLLSTVGAYVIAGGRDFSPPPSEAGGLLLLVLTVTQFLQIMFYVACLTAAMLIVDAPPAGLVTIGVLAALALLPIPAWSPIPIQRSATGSVLPGGGPEVLISAAVLMACTVVMFTIAALSSQIRRASRSLFLAQGAVPS
ncbi:MAG: hypothetical protein J0I97_05675 [Microbacterium sp.]|nr:hypothetical protein [Microbacterium sp.]